MDSETQIAEESAEQPLVSWIDQFAPYGVITLGKQLEVKTWNHWMEIHSGLLLEDVRGKGLFELFPQIQTRKYSSRFERALRGESSVLSTALHEYLLPLPNPVNEPGMEFMRQTSRIAPLTSHGVNCGVIIVIEDVTQREVQARALRQQHRRDEVLSWALAHLLESEEPRKTVKQLFFKIAEVLDFETYILYLYDTERRKYLLHNQGGFQSGAEEALTSCPFANFIDEKSNRPGVIDSIETQKGSTYEVMQMAGLKAAAAIPLITKGQNLGLLCFGSTSRSQISKDEADFLKVLGQYLATALDREHTNLQLHFAKQLLSDEAIALEIKVQERTSKLQETVSELEIFSYTLAHDLKAPVRAMTAFCEILLEDFGAQIPDPATLLITKLKTAAGRMESLTKDLLDFSRVSRDEIVLEAIDVEAVLENIIALRSKEVRSAITIQKPFYPVSAHRALLQQVLSNLIDNAMKFVERSTDAKITICAEIVKEGSPNTRKDPLLFNTRTLQRSAPGPACFEKQPCVRIWVRDEGIGIPAEVHQKIFGIFERGITTQTYEGTGMGLAIVARGVQRMGGTCGVLSEPGKGSHFWIELTSPGV